MRDILDDSRSQLASLENTLDPGKTRKAMSRIGIRALQWPFKSKDVEKIAQDLGSQRQAIYLYLQTYVAILLRYSIANELVAGLSFSMSTRR